ncbi:major facilitator superfamily domain-containing protein [Microdochium trichocladiopsis]|uniref:Major facilitator superfamily domain-containing protein n=1 Tax=Microdochium trichocladiopsis TaxID=1682393 RepID=A0A9P8YC75_9PEZI|nr:major facilitator superfamily domain-containing protein [Microdochium trichocladiopsis]KAH7035706.1 major facilitator superfamily domain-containing protein [Microdochium trichocladiopsis]
MGRNESIDMEGGRGTGAGKGGPSKEGVDEAEHNFQPRTLKFWTIIISIFLALFLVALDRTIVSTAVPAITQEFNSMGDIGWYGSAYQLTTAASQLLFGRIYKFYDIKRTFLVSILIFEVGAALSGAASSSVAFIIGRAIAGLGGAGIFSGVMIVMVSLVPLRKRPMFQGVFGSVFGLASVLGPLVGGAFTTGVTWRWCFFLNLPVGCFAAFCVIMFLHLPHKPSSRAPLVEHFTRLDPLGTFFFVPSVVSLLLALQWGGSKFAWDSWRIILLLCLFGAGMIAFGTVQVLMPKTATVPVTIITRRSIFAGAVFMFCLAGSMLLIIFFLPLWFQIVRGVSPLQSGINTLPFVISMVLASILNGGVTTKIGYYVPSMLLCPAIMAVGQGLMSTFTVTESTGNWVGYEIVAGVGLGLGMQAANLAAQAVLPKPDIPTGIAIMFFAQQLGGAIFTSVGQNLLSTTLASDLIGIPGIDPSQVGSVGAADVVSAVPPEFQPQVREIYNHALNRIFLCGMGVACVGVLAALAMEWKNIKKTGPGLNGGQPPKTPPRTPPQTPPQAPPQTPPSPGLLDGESDRTAVQQSALIPGVEIGASFAKSIAESTALSDLESITPPREARHRSVSGGSCAHCDHWGAHLKSSAHFQEQTVADRARRKTMPAFINYDPASPCHHHQYDAIRHSYQSFDQMSTSQMLSEYARLQIVARETLSQMQNLMQSLSALPSTFAPPNQTVGLAHESETRFSSRRQSRTRSLVSIPGGVPLREAPGVVSNFAASGSSGVDGARNRSGATSPASGSWPFPPSPASSALPSPSPSSRERVYTTSSPPPPIPTSATSPATPSREAKSDNPHRMEACDDGEDVQTPGALYEIARRVSLTQTSGSDISERSL